MRRMLLFGLFLFSGTLFYGQDRVMFENTDDLYEQSNFGANRQHFIHPFFGFGFYLPGGDQGKIKYWNTNAFKAGLRYKLKISKIFSTGITGYYEKNNFRFDEETQIIEDGKFYEKEKLIIHGAGAEYYFRINFDPERGNYIGNFVDIGIYGSWLFNSAYKTHDSSGGDSFTEKKTVYKDLSALTDFSYGVSLKMAKNSYVLYINHRISDYFEEENLLELPQTNIGLLIGLHQ